MEVVGQAYAMCEGCRKGTGTKEFDIISWPVVGQLLLFLFRHAGLEMRRFLRWRSLAVEVGAQAKDAAPGLPRLLRSLKVHDDGMGVNKRH